MKRHALSTRLWHWINALSLIVLFMSGLNISNGHRRLYWGEWGFAPEQAWLEVWRFPGVATIPGYYSLAVARDWHVVFAWVFAVSLLLFMLAAVFNGHFRRDVATRRREWRWSAIRADIHAHLRLYFDAHAGKYNFLQRLSYGVVLFILLPLMIFTGMAMSPGMDAAWPFLSDMFGGRQSARSIHFIVAWALLAFFVLHVALVLLNRPLKHVGEMFTGVGPMKRRNVLAGLAAAFTAGCTKIGDSQAFASLVDGAEGLHRGAHRLIGGPQTMAREYNAADISPMFRGNGNTEVDSDAYRAHEAAGFADWILQVGGLVEQPLGVTMEVVRGLPQRTQITRHDCVEGWSAIGQWTGPQLSTLLELARLKPEARFIVFRCADDFSGAPYYESCDLDDAFHPQTIIAHQLNGAPLPVTNGAPLRLRIERQLGYKHAKYLTGIEAVASLDGIEGGQGGYWEDRGYQWYAGV